MKSLYDFTYDQMGDMALEQGWKKFRAHQIFQWLYRKRAVSIDDMSRSFQGYQRDPEAAVFSHAAKAA